MKRDVPGYTRIETKGWLAPVAGQMGMAHYKRKAGAVTLTDDTGDGCVGVLCGHWVVGPPTRRRVNKAQLGLSKTHLCVSACGSLAFYQPHQIASGLPRTCYACRTGEGPPPPHATMRESDLPSLRKFFSGDYMATNFTFETNMKTRDATDQWDALGRPLMVAITDRTRFGSGFGWKCFVRSCQDRPKRSHRTTAHVRGVHPTTRRLELSVHPKGSRYTYTVDLTTPRTDAKFEDISAAVSHAIADLNYGDPEEDEKPELVAAAATGERVATEAANNGAGHMGPVDVAKLLKMKAGIENLLTVGKDINELAQLKAAAAVKLEQAEAAARAAWAGRQQAQVGAKDAAFHGAALRDRVSSLAMQLRNATADRDGHEKTEAVWRDQVADAVALCSPLEDELRKCQRELKELEDMEADRLKSVGDAKGMATLLQALAQMGG